jgi:hypothetical protein
MSIDGLHILDRAHFGPRVARRLEATGAGPVGTQGPGVAIARLDLKFSIGLLTGYWCSLDEMWNSNQRRNHPGHANDMSALRQPSATAHHSRPDGPLMRPPGSSGRHRNWRAIGPDSHDPKRSRPSHYSGAVLDGQLAINIGGVPVSWRAPRALRPFLAGESRVFAHRMYDHRPVRNPPTRS